MKQCSQCKQIKNEIEFYKNKNSKDGLTARCKACIKEYQQREDVRQRNKNISKRYYQTHKDTKEYKEKAEVYRARKLELNARWREENREHMKKYAEEHRERDRLRGQEHKNKIRSYNQEHQEDIILKYPTKTCSMCKQTLDRCNFTKDTANIDGLSYWCKSCQHDYAISRREITRQQGRDKYNSEKAMQYYYDNKDMILQKAKERQKQRREKDPKYVIDHTMQTLLNSIVKTKRQNSPLLLERCGYTAQQLLSHLELQFTPEMTWDNYGSYWEIDHIRPKYSFNYTSYDDEAFKDCWSLHNLRPLTVKENQSRNKTD